MFIHNDEVPSNDVCGRFTFPYPIAAQTLETLEFGASGVWIPDECIVCDGLFNQSEKLLRALKKIDKHFKVKEIKISHVDRITILVGTPDSLGVTLGRWSGICHILSKEFRLPLWNKDV